MRELLPANRGNGFSRILQDRGQEPAGILGQPTYERTFGEDVRIDSDGRFQIDDEVLFQFRDQSLIEQLIVHLEVQQQASVIHISSAN